MYKHAHTAHTTKHLLHMYVHTTCTFTQAHFGVYAYTKHVVKLVLSTTVRACIIGPLTHKLLSASALIISITIHSHAHVISAVLV